MSSNTEHELHSLVTKWKRTARWYRQHDGDAEAESYEQCAKELAAMLEDCGGANP
jgi:hypothetical protein